MRSFLRTTRGRLTFISVAILAIAFTLADAAIYLAFTYAQNNELDAQLRAEAVLVAAQLRVVDGKVTYAGGDLPHETPGGLAVDVAVIGEGGVLDSTPGQPLGPATLERLASGVQSTGRAGPPSNIADVQGFVRRVYATPVKAAPGIVLVASMPTGQVGGSVGRAMALVAALSIGALVIVAILIHTLVGRVLRPVSTIASLAESLSERELHRRIEVSAPDDELGQLVATFNRMLARLERSFNTLRRFTADASHELRAPLALMSTEVEMTLGRERSPAEYRRTLELVEAELSGMAGLVERLLLLARADGGQLTARLEELDVADFLHETGQRWEALAASRKVKVAVEAPDAGTAIADLGLTRRILDNLIDNAAKNSPSGGTVTIRADREAGWWVLEVADEGPGIAKEQRELIFERFGQLDTARTRDGSGVGLGLALGLAFARVQGGSLELADHHGSGAVFQLRLPAVDVALEGAGPGGTPAVSSRRG